MNQLLELLLRHDCSLDHARVRVGDRNSIRVQEIANPGKVIFAIMMLCVAGLIVTLFEGLGVPARLPALTYGAAAVPVLIGLAGAMTSSGRLFERDKLRAVSSIRFLGWQFTRTEPVFPEGAVRLSSEFFRTADHPPGYWNFRVVVDSVTSGAIISQDHAKALAFSEQLAEILGMEHADETDPESRGAHRQSIL